MAKPHSYREFWPFYVREHMKSTTRMLHFIGTTGVIVIAAAAIVTRNAWLLLAMPLCGYGFAWASHALIERNKPATFSHPFWSLMGDFHMYGLMLTGRMAAEVTHHGTGPRLADPTP
ncbi:MAG: DUF962 domain-containing protein [Alphaproteobacteria bacterium]|jgi:hypothetical protein|nr:DUF962 domain-containing protein [Rhodospirillaceae bacterium]MBT7613071.1 DUF962 domain-containing protein [Rhodospirillaceae bacterium]MBT7646858.1 DUF962 domain-containing protein [Rhodospirillaceae bacterium]MDG2481312.1 DUF962 domain-containing protein [Alphaproteobacteria bacterium]